MTCIIGLLETNKVIIGADSAAVRSGEIFSRKNPKVFFNGGYLFGCTSSFRMMQILQYMFKPPIYDDSKEMFEFIVQDFIESLRTCLKTYGYQTNIDSQKGDGGGEFILGLKNRLFLIFSDFQVGENVCEYYAIGSGAEYALGSLYESQTQCLSGYQRVENALKSSSFFSSSVCPPFTILST